MPKFYGKYRGKVLDNKEVTAGDGKRLGRILVQVPAVLGHDSSWAMPCVPYAGLQVGFFMMPPIGANVWVEFEGGEPSYPIWSGCFWGEDELPEAADSPTQKLIATTGISLMLNDMPGTGNITLMGLDPAVEKPFLLKLTGTGMTFEAAPALLMVTPENIEISLGAASVELSEISVSINDGALEVI